MVNRLETGSARLLARLRARASTAVVYRRRVAGVWQSVTPAPLAVIGATQFEETDEEGLRVQTESRDFIIQVADLALGAGPITPAPNDQIVETFGGQSVTYVVMAPGDNPPFRYSDQFRLAYRIHTQLVAAT